MTGGGSADVPTTTALGSSLNPSAYGQAVVFTATVSPDSGSATPTGSVGFTIDATDYGSSELINGSAFLFVSDLAAGPHTVSAAYLPDAGFLASSGSLLQTVTRAASGTALSADTSTSTYGDAVTLTASVAPVAPAPPGLLRLFAARLAEPVAPSGLVQFKDGTTNLGDPVPLEDGSAVLVTTDLPAGTHSLSASYAGDANFAPSTGSLAPNLVVHKAGLTISASDRIKAYGETLAFAGTEFDTAGLVNADTVSHVTLTCLGVAAGAAVGDYAITPSAAGFGVGSAANYTIHYANGTLTVDQAALLITARDQSKTYGEAFTFSGTEFTTVGLVGTDTVSGVSLSSDGAADSAAVGSYAITPINAVFGVGAAANYTISYVEGSLGVSARAVTVTPEAGQSKVYGSLDPGLTYAVTGGSLAAGDHFSGALERIGGEDVGSYSITGGSLALDANYSLTFTTGVFFSVTARPITVTAVPDSRPYDGTTDSAGVPGITAGDLAVGDTAAWIQRFDSPAVGTRTLTPAGSVNDGNGGHNYAVTFVPDTGGEITPRAITVTADAKSKVYGDADPALTYQITGGSLVTGDTIGGALERQPGAHVGSYAITQGTLALGANYTISYVGANLAITPRAITVTADAKSKVYGDADPALTYQITGGSLVTGDTIGGALEREPGAHVGSYAINQGTLALGSDYDLTYVGASLTIMPRPLTVTADAKSKFYGSTDPTLTYQITSGSLVTGDTFSGALNRIDGEDVGSYAITRGTLALGADYDLTFVAANFTVDPAALLITARRPEQDLRRGVHLQRHRVHHSWPRRHRHGQRREPQQ